MGKYFKGNVLKANVVLDKCLWANVSRQMPAEQMALSPEGGGGVNVSSWAFGDSFAVRPKAINTDRCSKAILNLREKERKNPTGGEKYSIGVAVDA
jgi:hypothetical protein